MTPRRSSEHTDTGAALLTTLAFVLLVGALSAGLLGLTASSIEDRTQLAELRDRQYAADAAVEAAIATVAAGDSQTVDRVLQRDGQWVHLLAGPVVAQAVTADQDSTPIAQSIWVFTAYVCTSSSACAARPTLRAQVNFARAADGSVLQTYVQSWSVSG